MIWQSNQTTEYISRQKLFIQHTLLRSIMTFFQFLVFFWKDLWIMTSGEPAGQWSVHLSDQRLQTNRAQSQPHGQRSVVSQRKVAKCEREICLSPSLNIITRGANWELRGLGPQDKLTSTMTREFRHGPSNVSQFPSVHSPDQTAFKLSSSHLSLNTVSWLDIRTMLRLDCLWENRYAEFP